MSSASSESDLTAAAAAGGGVPVAPAAGELPRVAIVGRPNTGKSTLFNRLLRRRKALVDPTPGVTRDPNRADVTWDDHALTLIDTGGFEAEGGGDLERAISDRSLAEAADADLVVYVLDGKAGLSAADEAAVQQLRRRRTPIVFVVNKLDSPARQARSGEFYRLGADELLPVSAEHGHGISALIETIVERVPHVAATNEAAAIRVGIVGRPNVGKSSLVNRLLGYQRTMVDATAGTTRDAVDTLLEVGGTRYTLVDTAGIRRRAKIVDRLERSSTSVALEALGRSDVAVIVIDAVEGATTQDMRLASLAWEEGRALVMVANKWDLRVVAGGDDGKPLSRNAFAAELRRRYPSVAHTPIVVVSALTGSGVASVLPAVRRVAAMHAVELQTARLNDVIGAAVSAQEPPMVGKRRPRIYYATQVGRRPPEIAIFTNEPKAIHPSYIRYLQNQIVGAFHLEGTPIRLRFRPRH